MPVAGKKQAGKVIAFEGHFELRSKIFYIFTFLPVPLDRRLIF